jgi:subtilisin inhibitor-like
MRRRVWIGPACLAAAALALAGCGGGGGLSGDHEGPTSLRIESFPPYAAPDLGGGDWTLRCDPAGGTLPGAAKACAALIAKPSLLEPPACEGGMITDQRALRITGTFRGQRVDFSRKGDAIGGCMGDQDAVGAALAALGRSP